MHANESFTLTINYPAFSLLHMLLVLALVGLSLSGTLISVM